MPVRRFCRMQYMETNKSTEILSAQRLRSVCKNGMPLTSHPLNPARGLRECCHYETPPFFVQTPQILGVWTPCTSGSPLMLLHLQYNWTDIILENCFGSRTLQYLQVKTMSDADKLAQVRPCSSYQASFDIFKESPSPREPIYKSLSLDHKVLRNCQGLHILQSVVSDYVKWLNPAGTPFLHL